MKTSVLMEIQYLAPIQSYTKYLKYPDVCIEQHENYSKGSFRNRCCIASANGVVSLTIPLLKGKHQQAKIKEVAIDNNSNWQSIHWKSIQTAYGNSPFFEYYKDDFIILFQKKYELLFNFCLDVHELVLSILQLKTTVSFSPSFLKKTDEKQLDFRSEVLPKNYMNSNDPYFLMPYIIFRQMSLFFLDHSLLLDCPQKSEV